MKIGARAHDFGRQSAESLSRSVKEAGFDAVQLALTKAIEGTHTFQEVTPAHLQSIEKSFAKNHVEISILGCYVEPSLPDKDERLRHVQNFLLGLSHAKALGVPYVGTETTRLDPKDEHLRPAAYENLKDSVLRMVEEAERLNVQIAIETVADHTLNTAALTRRLLDEVGSDKLKVILDPVNLILEDTAAEQEAIYKDFFNQVGNEIAVVHIKDIVFEHGEKVWRNIGQGMVNQACVFDWLRAHKPNIAALREHVKPGNHSIDIAAMKQLAGIPK